MNGVQAEYFGVKKATALQAKPLFDNLRNSLAPRIVTVFPSSSFCVISNNNDISGKNDDISSNNNGISELEPALCFLWKTNWSRFAYFRNNVICFVHFWSSQALMTHTCAASTGGPTASSDVVKAARASRRVGINLHDTVYLAWHIIAVSYTHLTLPTRSTV